MATTKRHNASSLNGSSGNGAKGLRKTESLWTRYRRTRSDKTRNQLVERYRGIVEGLAYQLAARLPSSVDVQDLAHAGMWGLMRAISTFEPERGIEFVAFMRIRVRGAMLDELRHMDHLPRLARHRRREFDAAASRLRESLQREPSDQELADELGVSVTTLWQRFWRAPPLALDGQRARDSHGQGRREPDSLEELVDEQSESPIELLGRRDLLDKIEASLQPLEWKVLRMHYLEGMSGKEVARRLRLSASRICQIHGRVLSRLKARLDPPG